MAKKQIEDDSCDELKADLIALIESWEEELDEADDDDGSYLDGIQKTLNDLLELLKNSGVEIE